MRGELPSSYVPSWTPEWFSHLLLEMFLDLQCDGEMVDHQYMMCIYIYIHVIVYDYTYDYGNDYVYIYIYIYIPEYTPTKCGSLKHLFIINEIHLQNSTPNPKHRGLEDECPLQYARTDVGSLWPFQSVHLHTTYLVQLLLNRFRQVRWNFGHENWLKWPAFFEASRRLRVTTVDISLFLLCIYIYVYNDGYKPYNDGIYIHNVYSINHIYFVVEPSPSGHVLFARPMSRLGKAQLNARKTMRLLGLFLGTWANFQTSWVRTVSLCF